MAPVERPPPSPLSLSFSASYVIANQWDIANGSVAEIRLASNLVSCRPKTFLENLRPPTAVRHPSVVHLNQDIGRYFSSFVNPPLFQSTRFEDLQSTDVMIFGEIRMASWIGVGNPSVWNQCGDEASYVKLPPTPQSPLRIC